MSFNSNSATMVSHLKQVLPTLIEVALHKMKNIALELGIVTEEGLENNQSIRAVLAVATRLKLSEMSLKETVVVDFTEAYEKLIEESSSPEDSIIHVMVEDVENWDELCFPFDFFILKVSDDFAFHVMGIEAEDNGKTYYTVTVYEHLGETEYLGDFEIGHDFTANFMVSGWVPTSYGFQLKKDDPSSLSFDDSYHCLKEEDKQFKERTEFWAKAGKSLLFCLLYLLKHKKLKAADAKVPLQRNTKRVKRNKPAYSEYKTMVLGDFSTTYPYYKRPEEERGTHASPKMHIRRGHWRRRKGRTDENDRQWIHSTVVGDPSKGTVIKEYKL